MLLAVGAVVGLEPVPVSERDPVAAVLSVSGAAAVALAGGGVLKTRAVIATPQVAARREMELVEMRLG